MSLSSVLVLGLLAVATSTDLLSRKIPNALIILGLCLGLGIANATGGLSGALDALLGAVSGLLVFLPFFALRWMGAGDVKLLAMVGSFSGVPAIFLIALYSALAGGILGLGSQFMVRLGWMAGTRINQAGSAQPPDASNGLAAKIRERFSSASLQLPYAVAIFAGFIIWLVTRGA